MDENAILGLATLIFCNIMKDSVSSKRFSAEYMRPHYLILGIFDIPNGKARVAGVGVIVSLYSRIFFRDRLNSLIYFADLRIS